MAKEQLVNELDLNPGDILLLKIQGWVGVAVWLMQAINRDLSKWTHVAVVLDDGTLFEAQPGGAVITPLSEYEMRPGRKVTHYQSRTYGDKRNHFKYELQPLASVLTDHNRRQIIRYAREHVGVGYAWSTYGYLALYRFGVRPLWLKRRIQDEQNVICSQAADLFYDLADVHLFHDGRMPYDVTPGDLARLAP